METGPDGVLRLAQFRIVATITVTIAAKISICRIMSGLPPLISRKCNPTHPARHYKPPASLEPRHHPPSI